MTVENTLFLLGGFVWGVVFMYSIHYMKGYFKRGNKNDNNATS